MNQQPQPHFDRLGLWLPLERIITAFLWKGAAACAEHYPPLAARQPADYHLHPAAALGLFLYYSHQNLYGGGAACHAARFSTVEGRLQATGTAGSSQATSESRSQSLRRTVEQFDEKDKFEFMLLDSSGVVLATSSGTMNKNLLSEGRDFYQAVTGSTGSGMVTFRTADGEHVMAVTSWCLMRRAM